MGQLKEIAFALFGLLNGVIAIALCFYAGRLDFILRRNYEVLSGAGISGDLSSTHYWILRLSQLLALFGVTYFVFILKNKSISRTLGIPTLIISILVLLYSLLAVFA
jgi:hypothetical protein